MPKAATKREVTTRRTNPIRGAAAAGGSKPTATKAVKPEPDVEDVKPTVAKSKAKAKISSAAAKKAPAPKKLATVKKPKAESLPPDPLEDIFSVLEEHRMTPADLILAIIKGSPHDGDIKYFQDDLYYPYGTSKLDTIFEELAVAKHGRKVLKEWISKSETGSAIVEKVIDQEMRDGEISEDDSDDDDDCGHCCA